VLGAGYWLLVLPRPQFWLPRMAIGTVIRRQADPSRPPPACNRSRVGQLGLSTCPESRCRVAGGRFQTGGTVSMAGFTSSCGSSWGRRLELRLRQLVIAIIILIITWHRSAFGNQSARLSGVTIAEWSPSVVYLSPSRFIASRASMSLIAKTGAGWHWWIHGR
jgi:hypothetical protein